VGTRIAWESSAGVLLRRRIIGAQLSPNSFPAAVGMWQNTSSSVGHSENDQTMDDGDAIGRTGVELHAKGLQKGIQPEEQL